MLQPVELRWPLPATRYASAIDLWAQYARGYISGVAVSDETPYVILRYEDVLERPAAVVDALAALGLRRNSQPFTVQDHIVDRSGGVGNRDTLLARQQTDIKYYIGESLTALGNCLQPHEALLTAFGYKNPAVGPAPPSPVPSDSRPRSERRGD